MTRGRLAVELVLDRADQLFQDVFEAHHADDAAVFVQQHCQVDPRPLELDEELVEPQGFGQEGDLAGELAEVGAGAVAGAGAEQVLDVDHAQDGGEIVLAEGESRVPGLPGDAQVIFQGARDRLR